MIPSGFPDLLAFASMSRTITQVRTDLDRAANEAVTGQRENLSRSLGASVGELALVDKALQDIDTGKSRLALAGNRLSQIGTALGAIRGEVEAFGLQALRDDSLGGPIGEAETAAAATAALEGVLTTLNTRQGGRSLFAGDAVDGLAIADTDTLLNELRTALAGSVDMADQEARFDAFFGAGGTFETTIYQGGLGQAAPAALGDGSQVTYEVRADSQAIRDTIEGFARLALAPELPQTGTLWTERAASKLSVAETGLVTYEAKTGRAGERVDEVREREDQERVVLVRAREALAGRDAFEAANEVRRLETQLEAAYTLTARLSRLSLTGYLR